MINLHSATICRYSGFCALQWDAAALELKRTGKLKKANSFLKFSLQTCIHTQVIGGFWHDT